MGTLGFAPKSIVTCDTGKAIQEGDSCYLLLPKEFGGGSIKESYYGGFGWFDRFNLYDKLVEWNKPILTKLFYQKEGLSEVVCLYVNDSEESANLLAMQLYSDSDPCRRKWKRQVGIELLSSKNISKLLFPAKVAERQCIYEDSDGVSFLTAWEEEELLYSGYKNKRKG